MYQKELDARKDIKRMPGFELRHRLFNTQKEIEDRSVHPKQKASADERVKLYEKEIKRRKKINMKESPNKIQERINRMTYDLEKTTDKMFKYILQEEINELKQKLPNK